jgi:pyruvate/2-oxoglutarate dehydrogenase complex dihydrolipoamide dehydrogenase (E3) component
MGRHIVMAVFARLTNGDQHGRSLRTKANMVDEIVNAHLDKYRAFGDELILNDGRFVGPRHPAALHDGGERALTAERVFVNVGTHATISAIPGLPDLRPMRRSICSASQSISFVLGGGYVGLELEQAMRRLGAV